MTPEQFAYWMQGFVELSGETPDEAQWNLIKVHLQTVFVNATRNPESPMRALERAIGTGNPLADKVIC